MASINSTFFGATSFGQLAISPTIYPAELFWLLNPTTSKATKLPPSDMLCYISLISNKFVSFDHVAGWQKGVAPYSANPIFQVELVKIKNKMTI
jgi:hypothetical protein